MNNPSSKNISELKISPETKLIQSLMLYEAARELKIASLKHFYPDLNEEDLALKIKEIFVNART